MKESKIIKYCKGYKYQLREKAVFKTTVWPEKDIKFELIELKKDGALIIDKYFAWDGASGPTWDDSTNMRASLVHDALYCLMRQGLLNIKWREEADAELRRYMEMDGALGFRAWYYEWAVSNFAADCAKMKNKRKILVAPDIVYIKPDAVDKD